MKKTSILILSFVFITSCGLEKNNLVPIKKDDVATQEQLQILQPNISIEDVSNTKIEPSIIQENVKETPIAKPITTPSAIPSTITYTTIKPDAPLPFYTPVETSIPSPTTTPTSTPTPSTIMPTPNPSSSPTTSTNLAELDQNIVGVYFPEGDPNFPSKIRHIFKIKNGKSYHYTSIGAILEDNFNENDIKDIDYSIFKSNFPFSGSIVQVNISIQKEVSNQDIYLVIEANQSTSREKYKRKFSNVQTLELYLGYFNISKETIVPDGTLSSIPTGKDIIRF